MRSPTTARLVLTLTLTLALSSLANAGKVKVWYHHTVAHFDKAQLKNVVISSEGALRLSRQLKPLADLKAMHIWDVVEDKAGNLFVATGDDGKLYKVATDGTLSVVYEGEESQILCLTLGTDSMVYAGTGPGGKLIRIDPKTGKSHTFPALPEHYIWSLAADQDTGTLYVGTGPKGRIYRLPRGADKATLWYTTTQDHVLCLAMGQHHQLYAGTDKNGLVYRVETQGEVVKGFVLYQASQSEIRSLLVTPHGLYVGTGVPSRRRPSSSISSVTTASLTALPVSSVRPLAKADNKTDKTQSDGGHVAATTESESTKESSSTSKDKTGVTAIPPPSAGENSLYRINVDGTVRELFREKALLLSLLQRPGGLLVGTGSDGQLFEVNEATRERTELARLDHGLIHCLMRRHDGSVVLGTGDPGKLYTVHDHYASKGALLSETLDARIVSKWGALRWSAETPPGTAITIAARSGNVAEPDDTWSSWSAEQTDAEQAIVAAPTARFLQYRVTLSSSNPAVTPSVRGLSLRYLPTNQAPEVTTIEVPDLDAGTPDTAKRVKFKWTATDPNEDELTYTVSVCKDGWSNWVQLAEDLEKREFEWDTTTAPAGIYRLKVVASDRRDNPEPDALHGERISVPFAVAHEAPVVKLKVVRVDGSRVMLEATATDPLVRLASASFAVNGAKWVNVFPTDGLFDSKAETFRFRTEELKPGTHVLVLRVRDAAGNIGSGDAIFSVQKEASK